MLSSLPPREREIVDILYERGASTVIEIGESLPDELSGSAIRAMLKRLEAKGFVVREQSERGFVYAPSLSDKAARKSALSQVVRRTVGRWVNTAHRRRPMIVPMVIEA